MRGSQIINRFISDESNFQSKQKGRSKSHLGNRNTALIHRYYFYVRVLKLRYDVVLDVLRDEFFLAPITIAEIIESNADAIAQICKEKPSVNALSRKFPFYNWDKKKLFIILI